MIKESYDLLSKEYSGEKVKSLVEQIISFHRIQASPGFRATAEYVAKILSESGLEVEIFKFSANEKTSFWNYSSFQESVIDEAQLFLISEHSIEKIADYNESRLSVIQRSIPTPINGIEAELIVLEKGEKEEEYKNLQIKGKIVLSSGDINKVFSLAVQKYGAIGIITDRITEWPPIREKIDLPDALQYTSFWWYPGMKKCFGFTVSPRAGMRIRAQARTKPLKVRAVITSKLYNGTLEVLSAKIPGETEEEILAVAHMCHPKPSANDNASGVCTLIETARVISALVRAGMIKKPRRTIRFLFVPEMTGTVAFLSNNEKIMRNIVAGLNLDMVGEDQVICRSILMVDSTPLAFPTFVNAYVKYLFSFLPKDLKTFSSSEHFSSFRYAFVKFSGGSDNEILSDPTVDIPTPSFTNWPDKYYHTSEDTIDKVSPKTLWNVGTVSMTYLYTMANICSLDFAFLAALTEEYCEEEINTFYKNTVATLFNLSQSNFNNIAIEQMGRWSHISKFWTQWLTAHLSHFQHL